MELNKNNMRKIMILIVFTIIIFLCLQNVDKVFGTLKSFSGLLSPFILGGCIAFIMNVPMRLIERNLFRGNRGGKFKRPVSILLTLVFILGIIFIVTFIIFPELGKTVVILLDNIPGYMKNLQKSVTKLVEDNPEMQEYVAGIELDWNTIGNNILKYVQDFSTTVFSSTLGMVSSIVSGLTNFVIGFVFAIYILSQKEHLSIQIKKILYSFLPEKKADKIISVFILAENTFANFLSGQCTEAIILGCMFFVTMTIFRFPYALLIGVLIAFTALIPIFGAFIGSVIGTFLILMVNPVQALWFILLFFILQQIEGNLIYPHVVGGSVGLPSIWVLFAVTIGGNLMGIMGMLIFIPLCSVIYALLRTSVNKRLIKRDIKDEKLEPRSLSEEYVKEDDKKLVSKEKKSFVKTSSFLKNSKDKVNEKLKVQKKSLDKVKKNNGDMEKEKNEKVMTNKVKAETGSFTKIDK